MCLIIYNPKGLPVKKQYIRTSYQNNSDGFGVMWVEKGRVRVIQGLLSLKDIFKTIERLKGIPHVIHMRYRTVGAISDANTHPFQILDRKMDGEDLWMMHNGTFSFIERDKTHSDTAIFAQKLKPILKDLGTNVLFDKFHPQKLAKKIGGGNKVVFMRNDGSVSILNEDSGFWEDGIWFSNRYSLQSSYRETQAWDTYIGGKSTSTNSTVQTAYKRAADGTWVKEEGSNSWELYRDSSAFKSAISAVAKENAAKTVKPAPKLPYVPNKYHTQIKG
jgi:Glutamine amidotransferases class-II